MNENIKLIINDRNSLWVFSASVILMLIQIAVVSTVYNSLPPVIPFFNSLPWGAERLSPSAFIFGIPILSLSLLVLNIYLLSAPYKKHALMIRMISVNTLLLSMLATLALAQILLLAF